MNSGTAWTIADGEVPGTISSGWVRSKPFACRRPPICNCLKNFTKISKNGNHVRHHLKRLCIRRVADISRTRRDMSATRPVMKRKAKVPFDPKAFLAKADGGGPSPNIERIKLFSHKEIWRILSFTSTKERSKSLSFPSKGRKPSSRSWGQMNSAEKVV